MTMRNLCWTIPDRLAQHGAAPHRRLAVALEARAFLATQRHPVAWKLLDPDRCAETQRQPRLEAVGVADRPGETPDEEELGKVAQGILVARRRLDQAEQRPEVTHDRRVVRSVERDDGLRPCPGTVEEQPEPMQQHVQEPSERAVAVVESALARIFGQVRWQGAVGPEEPEHALHQARPNRLRPAFEGGERCGREDERRFLREAKGLVDRPHAVAEARLVAKGALDLSHRMKRSNDSG
jgi:hypothetical protein